MFIRLLWCLSIIALLGAFTLPAARAGTTGGLSGTVRDSSSGAELSGVRVTLTSAAQNARATTDASGHFTFVSLAPDTYVLSLELQGYDSTSVSGVTVTADARQTVSLDLRRALKTIGRTTSRSAADLVRPGSTADVYSINARQQDVLSSLGGGGNLDTAYSAIGSVAGAYVPSGESGYNQAIYIRGGDAGEVGFEFDGIPVNRGFDNYAGGSLSSLGQLELQVYTGATPANAEAQGLAGFVNQVIRTGTYPSFNNAKFDLGSPTYYHSLNLETGGANPARTFSYYVGLGGYNQDFRYIDQFNGATAGNTYGPILYGCPEPPPPALASCFTNGAPNVGQAGAPGYVLGSPAWAGSSAANVASRTSVVNLHFGLPHGDGLKDDIQLLYDNNEIYSQIFSSPQEFGAANIANYSQPTYTDSWQYTGALGAVVSNPARLYAKVEPYLFPSSSPARAFDGPIPADMRDTQLNGQAIFKLQYQRNFDTRSYLRLYGYTYYSDYIAAGPNSSFQPVTGIDSGDYELNSHTRGVSATYANQLSQKHLLEAQAAYTTATSLRSNNTQMFGGADLFAVVVNPADIANPAAFNGTCYRVPPVGTAANPTSCNPGGLPVGGAGPATFASLSAIGCNIQHKGCPTPPTSTPTPPPTLTGLTCGTGSCAYYVAESGAYGEYNHVTPAFTGLSLTDTWKPSDRVTVTAGLRLDQYRYSGDNTDTGPARAFWYAAFNNDTCYDTATLQLVDKTTLFGSAANPIASSCASAGGAYAPVNMVNTPSQQFIYNVLQPRLGATYSLGPDTVLRGSFGKYNEQPSSAYAQYDGYQQNLPATLTGFYSYGFNTPGHAVRPEVSYNTDFSLEHHFRGTDISVKLSPFLRQTKDQLQSFYLDVKSGLISGLNVGQQTSDGFELAIDKGDFARNGFSAQLSFAYTNAYIKYGALANGTTILSPVDADISTYNAYTKGCAAGGAFAGKTQYGTPVCGSTSNGLGAAPCYASDGAPDPACAATSFANPYWNAPTQGLFDPSARYTPYSIFPGAIGTGDNSYTFPYVATLLLNYRHDKFALTPIVQFQAGNRYGSPETTPGIDPAAGCTSLGSAPAGDPRYPYGAAGGSAYDAKNCAVQLNSIPDPYTRGFDGIGAFRQPAQIVGNLRLSYDLTKRVELVATFANVFSRCFGGQKTAFTYDLSPQVCSYTSLVNSYPPVGNIYNPNDNVQTFQRYPYEPSFGPWNDLTGSFVQPFSVYLSARVKL